MRCFICITLLLGTLCGKLPAQSPDEMYRKPLKEVLDEMEKRFQVKIVAEEKVVAGKMVSFAHWRMKNDVGSTLCAVLGPHDLIFRESAPGEYQITPFQYHRRTPEEGRAHLAQLRSLYPELADWQDRRRELQECMGKALRLELFLPENPLNPVFTPKRKHEGYTTENVALETFPGLYLSGTLYRPLKRKPPFPAVLVAQGHGEIQHYGESSQRLAAALARMGVVVFSYDMFAKGESALQFAFDDHRTGLAQAVQTWNSLRVVDFLTGLPEVDSTRIAMTGASGGGTQTLLAAALDNRIRVSVPVVMVSSWFYGGCPCESGMPIHGCSLYGTNNAEIAAMAAPRPLLLVSDGGDWTSATPDIEFPAVREIYALYGSSEAVENAHFPLEGHDYGPSKREAVLRYLANQFGLSLHALTDKTGKIDESACTVQPMKEMLVFGESGEKLPTHAIHGLDELKKRLQWPF